MRESNSVNWHWSKIKNHKSTVKNHLYIDLYFFPNEIVHKMEKMESKSKHTDDMNSWLSKRDMMRFKFMENKTRERHFFSRYFLYFVAVDWTIKKFKHKERKVWKNKYINDMK